MVGPKTKVCAVSIILYPSLLTWLILESVISIKFQVLAFIITVIMSYITIVVLQDYFWLKSHPSTQDQRKDLHLVKPLFVKQQKGERKNV